MFTRGKAVRRGHTGDDERVGDRANEALVANNARDRLRATEKVEGLVELRGPPDMKKCVRS